MGRCATHDNRFLRRAAARRPKTMRRTHAHAQTCNRRRRRGRLHAETCEQRRGRVNRILQSSPPRERFPSALFSVPAVVTYRCSFVNARLPHTHRWGGGVQGRCKTYYFIIYTFSLIVFIYSTIYYYSAAEHMRITCIFLGLFIFVFNFFVNSHRTILNVDTFKIRF